MMTYEIIKNAEIPSKGHGGRLSIYPFASLDVGDGFDAPRDMGKYANGKDKRRNSMAASATSYVKRRNTSAKFTVRILDENTIRCVRIA